MEPSKTPAGYSGNVKFAQTSLKIIIVGQQLIDKKGEATASPFSVLPLRITKKLFIMAGAAGIEPANAGIKIRCLTAWRRPIK